MEGSAYKLRRVAPEDEAFLYTLSIAARPDLALLQSFPEAQRETLLRSQFDLQRRHYEMHFPDARHEIVLRDGQPVGRVWVDWRASEGRCLDIALLPEARGCGLGTRIIEDLKSEATEHDIPLTLHVEHNNPPARRLYERLGFQVESETDTHAFMGWSPERAD